MASRLLTRSKALGLAGARGLRALSTLPRDPAAIPAPSPRQPAVGSTLGLSKILGYEQASRRHVQTSGTQVLPRWFSTGASNGPSEQQTSKTVAGMVHSDAVKAQEGASATVTASSPSEATIGKYRISPLTDGKVQLLRKLGFSQDELVMIVKKAPQVLALSEEKIQRALEFLMRDVSLQAQYIAQRPALIMYSLEKRLMPRHSLLEVLRHKGLLGEERDYYTIAAMAEKKFVQKFVDPYKSSFPGLADDYASACIGKA